MNVNYDIVHLLPDKTRQLVATVSTKAEMTPVLERSQYAGTWISPTRKILRRNRGELLIVKKAIPASIRGIQTYENGREQVCRMTIANHNEVGCLEFTTDEIIGYDHTQRIRLWTATGFNALAIELDNKQLAYDCMQQWEAFISENGLQGAM